MLSDGTGANAEKPKQSGNRSKPWPFPAVKGERMARRIRFKRLPKDAVARVVETRFDCRIHALENAFNEFGPFKIKRDQNKVSFGVGGADGLNREGLVVVRIGHRAEFNQATGARPNG